MVRRRTWLILSLMLALAGITALAAGGRNPSGLADEMLAEQLHRWQDPAAHAATVTSLRAGNAEWDFMWRTFLVLSLADLALAQPDRTDELLGVVDSIIQDTLQAEAEYGQRHFLMAYVDRAPFVHPSGRSAFVDGEIALMMAARRMVRDDPGLAQPMWARLEATLAQMQATPSLLAESYPDEVWLFCNTNALVALTMGDLLDKQDHSAFIRRWVKRADAKLREPYSGLLGSEFTLDGSMNDGPEGSSIWLVATNLLLLDPNLARDQYDGARKNLFRSFLGVGWAREWGPSWQGPTDVDSGPIVPIIEASASSSGFALMAAQAFDDGSARRRLLRSLRAAELVLGLDEDLAALTENAVGDAVVLHALAFGPLWDEVRRRQGPKP